jgi:hypothetical protein
VRVSGKWTNGAAKKHHLQGRKNYGGDHGRLENKGPGSANQPFVALTFFMKFRGPEALKDR